MVLAARDGVEGLDGSKEITASQSMLNAIFGREGLTMGSAWYPGG